MRTFPMGTFSAGPRTVRELEVTPGRKAITYRLNGEVYTDNWRSVRRFVQNMDTEEILSVTGISPTRTGLFVAGGNGEIRMADPDRPFRNALPGGISPRSRLNFINWA